MTILFAVVKRFCSISCVCLLENDDRKCEDKVEVDILANYCYINWKSAVIAGSCFAKTFFLVTFNFQNRPYFLLKSGLNDIFVLVGHVGSVYLMLCHQKRRQLWNDTLPFWWKLIFFVVAARELCIDVLPLWVIFLLPLFVLPLQGLSLWREFWWTMLTSYIWPLFCRGSILTGTFDNNSLPFIV